MAEFFAGLWDQFTGIFTLVKNPLVDILDILLVAFIFYKAVQFMRETRAEQLIKGIAIFAVVFFLSSFLSMRATSWLMRAVIQNGILAIIVLFQPELRSALERMGRSKLRGISKAVSDQEYEKMQNAIVELCKAVHSLHMSKTGALIVMERETMLGDIVQTGTIVDAAVSKELLCNLFYPNTPLHDGAVVIRGSRIVAAGCILPLTQRKELEDSQLGTRHRASLGCSENSDALVIVVSEETGTISVAQNGVLERNFNFASIRSRVETTFLGGDDPKDENFIVRLKKRLWKKGGRKRC